MGWIENLFRKPFTLTTTKNEFATSYDKFDAKFVQSLYRNNNDKYALAAGFVKPIIDTTVGFVGIPYITDSNGNEDDVMKSFNKRKSFLMSMVRDSMLESRIYVRADILEGGLYAIDPNKKEVVLELIEDARVKPQLGGNGVINGHKIETDVRYDAIDANKTYKKFDIVYKDRIEVKTEGAVPVGTVFTPTDTRLAGIYTLVAIVNEPDKNGKGISDVEPLIPYLAIYHQIMNHANQYKNMHSEPKIKMKVKDWELFRQMNAAIIDINGNISLDNGTAYFVNQDDDVAYISAPSAMADFTALLNYVFLCIVQASQTPEWLLGAAISSSKASAETQTVGVDVKVSRKRTLFNDQVDLLYRTYAQVYTKINGGTPLLDDVVVNWDNVRAATNDVSANGTDIQQPQPTPTPTPTPQGGNA